MGWLLPGTGTKCFILISSTQQKLPGKTDYHPHFTDEETKDQRNDLSSSLKIEIQLYFWVFGSETLCHSFLWEMSNFISVWISWRFVSFSGSFSKIKILLVHSLMRKKGVQRPTHSVFSISLTILILSRDLHQLVFSTNLCLKSCLAIYQCLTLNKPTNPHFLCLKYRHYLFSAWSERQPHGLAHKVSAQSTGCFSLLYGSHLSPSFEFYYRCLRIWSSEYVCRVFFLNMNYFLEL